MTVAHVATLVRVPRPAVAVLVAIVVLPVRTSPLKPAQPVLAHLQLPSVSARPLQLPVKAKENKHAATSTS